jgi:uncharacterized protein
VTALDLAGPPPSPESPQVRPLGPIWSVVVTLIGFAAGFLLAVAAAMLTIGLSHPLGLAGVLEMWRGESLADDVPLTEQFDWLLMIYAEIFAALFILAVAVIRGGRSFRALLGLNVRVPAKALGIGLLVVAVYLIAGMALEAVFPAVTEWLEELLELPEDATALWLAAFGIVVSAPLCEELIFRGFLYTSFRECWGVSSALIGTSMLFALAHFEPTLLYALLVLPLAFLLGWAREVSRGIALPVMLHMSVNLVSFCALLITTRMEG